MVKFVAASAAALALVAAPSLAAPQPAHAQGPTVGTTCTDTNKIVSSDAGEIYCKIISSGPWQTQWKPFDKQLETVVKGSSCGPPGWGDFRFARSTDDYLVWCMGQGPSGGLATWVVAVP